MTHDHGDFSKVGKGPSLTNIRRGGHGGHARHEEMQPGVRDEIRRDLIEVNCTQYQAFKPFRNEANIRHCKPVRCSFGRRCTKQCVRHLGVIRRT
jgi:hypothetical protein